MISNKVLYLLEIPLGISIKNNSSSNNMGRYVAETTASIYMQSSLFFISSIPLI
jgi:hypothetical protein